MPDTDFNIPDFLRAIGKGPEERPEWWRHQTISEGYKDSGIACIAPFSDILDHWTPDKDALLLGTGLEWWRENQSDEIEVAVYKIGFQSNMFWESELMRDPKPGERLARGIWAAMGDGK